MSVISVHEAKTHLSRLINQVLAGEEVVVTRGKHPVIRLVPFEPIVTTKRELGWLAHELSSSGKDPLGDGFWDAPAEEELALWEGENDEKWQQRFSSTPTR